MNINQLNSYTQFEPPSIELGQEKKTSTADNKVNKTGQETSQLTVNNPATNNAAKCSLSDQAKYLQQATDEILQEPPPVDRKKIATAIEKIRTGELGILKSNIEERLASAEKIANALLEN